LLRKGARAELAKHVPAPPKFSLTLNLSVNILVLWIKAESHQVVLLGWCHKSRGGVAAIVAISIQLWQYRFMGISVKEAAERLSVNTARVRALIAAGVLSADKVGGRWLVDETSVARQASGRIIGRPFSPARSWGLLMLASNRAAPWLSRSDRSKLRRRLRETAIQALAPRLRKRADVCEFRAHSSDLKRIASDGRTVLTGISAAQVHKQDLSVVGQVEAYVRVCDLRRLQRDFHLEPSRKGGNVTLRVVDRPWPFGDSDAHAPEIVVAVELLSSDDQRTRRAGTQILTKAFSR
jgi:excisionase family DNA binding protein